MGWIRSAEMSYVSFQFNKDAAHRSVERLGEMTACVNARDRWEGTPLRDAVREGHSMVATELLSHGGTLVLPLLM